jgi:penicillin-binding protein 1C
MLRHDWPWAAAHACDAVLLAAESDRRPPVLASDLDLELQGRLEAAIRGNRELPGDGLAVVVLERPSGALCAVVGDRDADAPLDLSRARRSAGSTLKPFLCALAHELGVVGPATLFDDAPLLLPAWRPANFDRSVRGRMRPGDALAVSSNLVAVRCLQQVGSDAFAELLLRLGLPGAAAGPVHLDAALGTGAVTPRELAAAYWRFVEAPASLGLSARSVDFTLAAMRRLPLVAGRSRPGELAWKSGTSSGRRDAWCVGITVGHVVVVWLGNRDGRGEAGLVGVRAASSLLAAVVGVL